MVVLLDSAREFKMIAYIIIIRHVKDLFHSHHTD